MAVEDQHCWHINQEYFVSDDKWRGKWRLQSLPTLDLQTQFRCVNICDDISCTVSHCLFDQAYYSNIDYDDPTTLIVFGIEGISEFTLVESNETCTVRPGDVWLINVDEGELRRHTPAQQSCQMAVIRYSTARLNQAFNQSDEQAMLLTTNRMQRLAFQQTPDDWISDLIANPMLSVADRLLAEAKALELIARWLVPDPLLRNPSLCQTLKQVVSELSNNIISPPSLLQLAQSVGMSHTRLNRAFKHQFGMTVFDWLRQHRLERAQIYLIQSEQTVTEIAQNCGFSNASHLTQCFKTQYGMTPSQYRIKQGD
ncbi:helix-turn-helix transcriptional regulator [Vibrio rhodolitus]|uniref:helix-turn-helix transcriptional regulator n=1 Tax=Vibrio rhodolitus TaxID=2231649 RepID=UPI000E0A27D9|nr:AraC family transcriptional regulator [Vibrio rhodolitus]